MSLYDSEDSYRKHVRRSEPVLMTLIGVGFAEGFVALLLTGGAPKSVAYPLGAVLGLGLALLLAYVRWTIRQIEARREGPFQDSKAARIPLPESSAPPPRTRTAESTGCGGGVPDRNSPSLEPQASSDWLADWAYRYIGAAAITVPPTQAATSAGASAPGGGSPPTSEPTLSSGGLADWVQRRFDDVHAPPRTEDATERSAIRLNGRIGRGAPLDLTDADVTAIRAARDFCRARHMPGHPALDTLAERIDGMLTGAQWERGA